MQTPFSVYRALPRHSFVAQESPQGPVDRWSVAVQRPLFRTTCVDQESHKLRDDSQAELTPCSCVPRMHIHYLRMSRRQKYHPSFPAPVFRVNM